MRYASLSTGPNFQYQEFSMIAAAPAKHRGVACQHCGKPIRLSGTILNREFTDHSDEADFAQELQPRPDGPQIFAMDTAR
jgi:hypothetical protein